MVEQGPWKNKQDRSKTQHHSLDAMNEEGQLHLRKTDLKNSTLLLRSREIEESLRKGSIEDSARGRTLHVEDSARRKQKN